MGVYLIALPSRLLIVIVYVFKFLQDGNVDRLRAKLMVKEYTLGYSIDYFETLPYVLFKFLYQF